MQESVPASTSKGKRRALILWAHPRTRSTMTERCFIAREDIDSFHEPFGYPFYYGPERISPRFTVEQSVGKEQSYGMTFDRVWSAITTPGPGKVACFSKDMAKFIVPPPTRAETTPPLPDFEKDGNPTIIPTSKLLDDGVVHAFLIRSPEGTVPSWYKVVSSPTIDYKGFVPEEIGIHEVRILYDFIASKSSQPPLVIDSDSIVKDPVKVLQKLCPIADIEYREDMLNWEATAGRAKELFDKWPEWHTDAANSTKVLHKEAKRDGELPEIVRETIADNKADYDYMKTKAFAF